ncbi:hypothetical protein GCM10027059_29640 [Myceligenerans halotolerans]
MLVDEAEGLQPAAEAGLLDDVGQCVHDAGHPRRLVLRPGDTQTPLRTITSGIFTHTGDDTPPSLRSVRGCDRSVGEWSAGCRMIGRSGGRSSDIRPTTRRPADHTAYARDTGVYGSDQ